MRTESPRFSNNKIGVMQGRLLSKFQNRYQAHPLGYWKDEFKIAADLNLDLIEFIFDHNAFEENPLMSNRGCNEIKSAVSESGVSVETICADYFMTAPLNSEIPSIRSESVSVLKQLVVNASSIGVKDIILPLVDQSRLTSAKSKEIFISAITELHPDLEKNDVNLSLETDLPPHDFKQFIDQINSDRITINYDTGNSAGLGYDPEEEFSFYGKLITDIHIKDRVKNGSSVHLGQGSTDFVQILELTKKYEYRGPFILQAFRDDDGLKVFKSQLAWFLKQRRLTNNQPEF